MALNLMLPGNPRYQPKSLQPIWGYDNLYRPVGEVEIATMQTLGDIGVIPKDEMALLTPSVIKACYGILTTDVDEIERSVTGHDIRAWIMKAFEILPKPLHRWLHIMLTSYDPIATAHILQFTRAHQQVLRPAIRDVVKILEILVRLHATDVQIGRTHGQHAIPITVGFWLATILERIITNAEVMERCAEKLVGKISGAVGAYNAQVLFGIPAQCGTTPFEERVLSKLGLKPGRISTQILAPEQLAYYLQACAMLQAAFGQLGRDCRHLMRSEIGEIVEDISEGQVGSSTMAHKHNPARFESLEGMWKRTDRELGKVNGVLISEHQRDLVGSSIMRDLPIIVVNLTVQLETLLRKDRRGVPFLSRIKVNTEACKRNLAMNAHLFMAEPLYIALQIAGFGGNAHKLINDEVVPHCAATGQSVIQRVEEMSRYDERIRTALERVPAHTLQLLKSPERYIGDASTQAHKIADRAIAYLKNS